MSFIIQPSAAGSGVFAATASGAITANKPCILNANGTVSEVVFDPYSVSALQSYSVTWEPIGGQFCDIGNNNVALLVYDTTTGYPGIVVGTLSGAGNSTLTFGSMTVLTTSRTYPGTVPTRVSTPYMVFDAANNKLIVAWVSGTPDVLQDPATYGDELDIVVCTVSGTTITPGSLYTWSGANPNNGLGVLWDSSAARIALFYGVNPGGGSQLYYQLFSISGTVVTRVTAESACGTGSNNRFVSAALFAYESNSNRLVAITNNPAAGNNRVIFTFSNSGSALTQTASSSRGAISYTSVLPIVGSAAVLVAGDGAPFVQPFAIGASSITAGTGLTISSSSGSSFPALSRTAAAGICFYSISSTTYGKSIVTMTSSAVTLVSPSGTNNVSFGSGNYVVYSASASIGIALRKRTTGIIDAYAGNAIGSNLTSAIQFVGFATAAATNGGSVNIATMGSQISGQSGLVLPNFYYVQTDGTLSTTPASPSVFAGYALKSDTLLVKGTAS